MGYAEIVGETIMLFVVIWVVLPLYRYGPDGLWISLGFAVFAGCWTMIFVVNPLDARKKQRDTEPVEERAITRERVNARSSQKAKA